MANVELLAPAGNADSLRAAVTNGADAVYLGLNKYSARAKAFNFDISELKNAVEYAHLFGVRVYVAINTLIKNSEMDDALDASRAAYELGVDAFIVQDLGFLTALKKAMPDAEIHASTQMGVHNKEGAKILEDLGVKRVILSRETTLPDISEIKKSTELEIEFFIHGAMCVSFSGNCYFSGLVTGNSGNRGQCLQFCRKRYDFECGDVNKSGYMLSAKDLMLLPDLKKLIDAGVDSFKIEGRMRRAAYVGETVRAYRNAIDCIKENRKNCSLDDDIIRLKSMFNRGDYCKAHLFAPTENIIYPYINGHIGQKIGVVEQVFGKQAAIRSQKPLKSGDGLKFLRGREEVGSASVTTDKNVTGFSGNVKKGDEVYLTTDSELIGEIEARKRFLPIIAKARFEIGKCAELTLKYNDITVVTESNKLVEKAANAPLSRERIGDILTAQSDEIFKITVESLYTDDNIFMPIGEIKLLKRAAIELLKAEIIKKHSKNATNTNTMSDMAYQFPRFSCNYLREKQIFVQIESLEAANCLHDYDSEIDYLVLNPKVYDFELIKIFAQKYGKRSVLNMPNIARDFDMTFLRKIVESSCIENFIANNLYSLELCKDKNVLIGLMMNLINDGIVCDKIVSPERGSFDFNQVNYVFGKLPVMTLTHCPKKNLTGNGCSNCEGYTGSLKDEYGNKFALRRRKVGHCYSELLNSVPIYLADKAKESNVKKLFIDFTGYENSEIARISNTVFNGAAPEFQYTRGYFNKKLR